MERKVEYVIVENNLTFKPDLCGCFTLDEVAERLRSNYSPWLVYKGGHHVALHRGSGEPRQLLIAEIGYDE